MYPELTESERFPRLSETGRRLLHAMRQHPHAPIWNWPNGEQLNDSGLERVHQFADRLAESAPVSTASEPPWVVDWIEYCQTEVPFYRRRGPKRASLVELPTCRRSDMAPRVWEFVPDSVPLDNLVVFSSSGTTGHPTRTPHHPVSAACGVPLIEHALRSLHGIEMPRGSEHVAINNVVAYPGAFTTAMVVSYLGEAGCIRVNLDPSAWRSPSDCHRYINHWQAPIWLGDPVAFGALEELDTEYAPQAIVSSILQLTDAYAAKLRARYNCPVLDLYAMTEAGIIAAKTEAGHRILPHDLFVEILDPDGHRVPLGTRGEIVLTGGRNPFLPLLRYRTSDFAAMELIDGHRVLVGLEGRQPIFYPSRFGRSIHSMQINRIMRQFPVFQYRMDILDDRCRLTYRGDIDSQQLQRSLHELFGEDIELLREGTS
jgi:phenylacetate-CoA ligase